MPTDKSIKAIHLFSPGPIGGAEKVVLAGLASLKITMDVELWIIREERVAAVSDKFIGLVKEHGIPYRIFNSSRLIDFSLLIELRRMLKLVNPAILHTHGFRAALYGRLSKQSNLKFIHTHHGKTAHTFKVRIYERIEDLIMRLSDGVIAVSKPMEESLLTLIQDSKKIHLIENPLTLDISSAEPKEAQELVYIGRLSQEKGIQDLIEAMKLLSHKEIKIKVLGDGALKGWAEEQISTHKLHDQISMLGFQKDVGPYLAQAAGLILPSHREGLPLTLIEACCSGKPVIGTRVGGIPSLVSDGKNGILVEASDPKALAQAIEKFFENRSALQSRAMSMRAEFLKRFDVQTWSENTLRTYQRVLSHS